MTTKPYMVVGLIALMLASIAPKRAFALDEDTDLIRAQAYIALADELYSQAQDVAETLREDISARGVQVPTSQQAAQGFAYTSSEVELLTQYNAAVAEAASTYERIFGSDYGMVGDTPFNLPIAYNYLKRDAYDKWTTLQQGFLFGAYRTKGANLYSVNADFKKDVLERTGQIVTEMQALNQDEQRLRNDYNTLQRAQIDQSGQVVNIDQTLLQTQNYSTDNQTQISQYQGQIASLDLQEKNEADQTTKLALILAPAQDLFQRNWGNLMNIQATSGNSNFVTVQAAWNFADAKANPVQGSFGPGTRLLLRASGMWIPKGIASGGAVHTGRSRDSSGGFSFFGAANPDYADTQALAPVAPLSPFDATVAAALQSGALTCDASGVTVTNNESVSETVQNAQANSVSASVTASGGFSFFGNGVTFQATAATSDTTTNSNGSSQTQGLTLPYKLSNSDMPDATLGSLIAFVDWPGRNPQDVQPIYVGPSNVVAIPDNAPASGVVLYLMQNDVVGRHGANTGSLQVEITETQSFATYAPIFLDWLNKDCTQTSPDGTSVSDCGFQSILNEVAYENDPQGFAQSALNVFLDTVNAPAQFNSFVSDIVKASVSLKMAYRDLDLALQQMEQTKLSAISARQAYQNSLTKDTNTQEQIEAIQRRADIQNNQGPLLAAAQSYYQDELTNLEVMKKHILARLQRYMGITVDSFNYLYLSDYKIQGTPTPGHEGDFYKQVLDTINDQVLQVDSNDDLLNPNQGFVEYDLTPAQLTELKSTSSTAFTLTPDLFFCQGYGIEDQVRVFIEKVGYLLDIDPINEQYFFKNPNVRRMAIRTTHGNSNIHFDLDGNPIEYYLPAQTKDIYGFSQRVLTDYHSDYLELGLSNVFQRTSFRNTSYATDWKLQLLDTQNFDLSYLNGIKFVVYFTSTEAHNGKIIQECQGPPARPGQGVRRGHWK